MSHRCSTVRTKSMLLLQERILSTIKKGITLLAKVILNNNLHYLELKSISSIIITYLPTESRTQEEIESYALWIKFNRFLSRSNRRTSIYRLSLAAQKMGREFPKLESCCDTLINKIYKLIRGETGKILDNEARNKFEVDRIKIDVKLAKLRKNK